jgi:hypothetical protein
VHAEAAATGTVPPTTGVAASADHYRTDLLARIKNLDAAGQAALRRDWPIPGKTLPQLNELELDCLEARITQVETEFEAPFRNDTNPVLPEIVKEPKPVRKTTTKKKAKK